MNNRTDSRLHCIVIQITSPGFWLLETRRRFCVFHKHQAFKQDFLQSKHTVIVKNDGCEKRYTDNLIK